MSWTKKSFCPAAKSVLAGIRVLDMSRLVSGNMTSLQLADHGADVVKIEPLPDGDPLRAWHSSQIPTFWKTYSRNKRSLALDIRADGGVALIERLVTQADVLIENFRPGTLEAMGLAPQRLVDANPGLIVLRVSGFGQSGPYGKRPGFGTLVEAMSGFAAKNGEPGGDPLLPPLALADMVAGLYGAFGIMSALYSRHQTGQGQVIDLSLLEPMVSVLGPEQADWALTGQIKPRAGNASNTSSPRNVYRTKDGQFIALSASIQRMAERVFRVIGREDMIKDPRYRSNTDRVAHRDEVDRIVGGWIQQRDRAQVMDAFAAAGITASPIFNAEDIANDPHFQQREVFVDLPDEDIGSITMHSPIPRLSATPASVRFPAPRLGEHSRDILLEAGLDAAEIEQMIRRGMVGAAP